MIAKTSVAGAKFVAALEGVVTRAYRDVAGTWTIGVGHTAAAGPPFPASGMTITQDEALAILARDLGTCEPRVSKALQTESQAVFDGGVSFDFNTGAIDRASWVPSFRAGDLPRARQALMEWTKAGRKTVPGLVARRAAEARLIFDDDYGAPDTATARVDRSDVTLALQTDLATLGFYRGAQDGVAGEAIRAAVTTYQKSHPDLVADGVAGPATRASIARDLAARRAAGASAGAVAAAAAGSGVAAAHVHAAHPWLLVTFAVGAVLLVVGIILLCRWGGELKRAITPTAKDG